MAKGFTPVDHLVGLPCQPERWRDIVQIDFGYRTGWKLVAECVFGLVGSTTTLWITADRPISYRVHDERELIPYWDQIAIEEAAQAVVYEIESSAYLDEIALGSSGLNDVKLRHFLISMQNTCFEVISPNLPVLQNQQPTEFTHTDYRPS